MKLKPHGFLIVLAVVFLCLSAAGSMTYQTRDWSVASPAGHFGFIESERITLDGQHAGWKTLIIFGPLQLTLFCRLPTALFFTAAVLVIAGWLVNAVLSRMRDPWNNPS